jgi:glucose-6-phosphate 1-dehydrogenase
MSPQPRRAQRAASVTQPTIFVLFGATGDLARRMVLPAFYRLAVEGLLPSKWLLVGNGRGDVAHEDFRAHVHRVLLDSGQTLDTKQWSDFCERLLFAGGGFETADPGSLLDVVAQARKRLGTRAQLVHYCAVPPVAFTGLTKALGEHDLAKGARIVYEKPFGTSPSGFRALDRVVHSVFEEPQVYRIDHFLGKEATQNVHVARFANNLFSAIWDREHIESVQIDVPEKLGITDRAVFYDATGVVLDMVVTHLFQLAAEIAMEPPKTLSAEDLQAAREKAVASFRPLDPAETVLGQFEGYRDVEGIAARSKTPTYAATTLWVDNARWRGVPFYLRTGKRMAASEQRVSLVLHSPAGPLAGDRSVPGNVLSFDLGGAGGVDLSITLKRPGAALELEPTEWGNSLSELPGADPLPPYVRLIHDVLIGDRSLFTRADGLSAGWKAVAPVLDNPPRLASYAPGTWGPTRAARLTKPGGWLLGQ